MRMRAHTPASRDRDQHLVADRKGNMSVHKGTLEQAKKAMAAAEAKAKQNNWNVVISIADSGVIW